MADAASENPGPENAGAPEDPAGEREGDVVGPTMSRSDAEGREKRPDIRAAKTETRIRRWALGLLVAVPIVYVVVQKIIG